MHGVWQFRIGAETAPRKKNDTTLKCRLWHLQSRSKYPSVRILTNCRPGINTGDCYTIELVYILLSIFRRYRRCIVDLNTTPLLFLAVMEWQSPATFIFWCAQPQPHQVPPRCWRRVVLVRCPSMEDMVIGKELDVAYIQNHVQSELLACFFQNRNGALLGLGKRRNETSV